MKNIQELLNLLQNSHSLSVSDKKRIAKVIPAMTILEQENLRKVLIYEQDKLKNISDAYQTQAKELHEEYDQVVDDFKHKIIPKIRRAAEEKDRAQESSKADEMIDSL